MMRIVFPTKNYLISSISTKPASYKFGFDRGNPIDRFWIENFLKENKKYIKGRCLEVTDATYIYTFGQDNVKSFEVLDIDTKNDKATIIGDLRKLPASVKDNQFDCIILTHVLGLIDDMDSAISEIYRILKPGGTLLFTGSCLGPILGREKVYWRFTTYSLRYLLAKKFKNEKIAINMYGNAIAGQALWMGLSQEDLNINILLKNDEHFPCVVSAIATK